MRELGSQESVDQLGFHEVRACFGEEKQMRSQYRVCSLQPDQRRCTVVEFGYVPRTRDDMVSYERYILPGGLILGCCLRFPLLCFRLQTVGSLAGGIYAVLRVCAAFISISTTRTCRQRYHHYSNGAHHPQ